jgi:hypothetical protein
MILIKTRNRSALIDSVNLPDPGLMIFIGSVGALLLLLKGVNQCRNHLFFS